MKVLVISPFYPYPVTSGGHSRIYNLICRTGRKHEIRLLSLLDPTLISRAQHFEGLHGDPLFITAPCNSRFSERLEDTILSWTWSRFLKRRLLWLKGYPHRVVLSYFPNLTQMLTNLITRCKFDIVQVEYTEMGLYVPLIRKMSPSTHVILDEIDISFVPLERRARLSQGLKARWYRSEAARMRSFEYRLWTYCDEILTMSEVDRNHVLAIDRGKLVRVVPNGVDTAYYRFYRRREESRKVIYLGYLNHPPNVEGLLYFSRNILPRIKESVPEVTVEVVGGGNPPEIDHLRKDPAFRFHGFVQDIEHLMRDCRVMIVPLLSAGGTRLKILEAFAAGIPVVSTSIGCEGLNAVDDQEILVSDHPDAFAQRVLELLSDVEKSNAMAERARKLVEERYDWDSIADTLSDIWEGSR